MSIDERAHTAAVKTLRSVERAIDPALMLQDLHRIRRRRRMATIIGSVAITAAVVGGAALVSHTPSRAALTPPANHKTAAPPAQCQHRAARCPSNRTFHVPARVPVTFSLPANFSRTFQSDRTGAEVYRTDATQTGVSILENAVPVKDDATWSRDPSAGTDAESVAKWLRERPFLVNATLTRTTVGGLPAWRVSAQLKRGAKLPAPKAGIGAVAPTFIAGPATLGYWPDLSSEYTLVDVPGAGVTVIWSWSLNHDRQVLLGNEAFILDIRFR